MKLLEVVVFLISFAGYATTNGITITNYLLPSSVMKADLNADEICATAQTDGMACSDCYNVVYCSKDGDGKWVVESIGQCPSGKICDKGSCVISNKCPLPNLQFKCLTQGSFPDPVDCKKFHVCVSNPLIHYELTCENSDLYGYNPLTTVCSDKLVNKQCQTNHVPTCTSNFQVGVVTANPCLHYECRNYTDATTGKLSRYLYPYQKRCDNGKKFDLRTEQCL